MFIIGKSGDTIAVRCLRNGVETLAQRDLRDAGNGDLVVSPCGIMTSVSGYQVERVFAEQTTLTLRYGLVHTVCASSQLLVRRVIPYKLLAKHHKAIPDSIMLTPAVWIPARDVNQGDYLCLPHLMAGGFVGEYQIRQLEPVVDTGKQLKMTYQNRLYRRPWRASSDQSHGFMDRVGVYLPIDGKRVSMTTIDQVSISVSSIGSVIVNGVAVRARNVLAGIQQDV